jgi:hypothetical protein
MAEGSGLLDLKTMLLCAGKDRTGIIVMLLLMLCGVDKEARCCCCCLVF